MNPNPSVPLFREESLDEARGSGRFVSAIAYGTIGWLAGRNFYRRYQGRGLSPETLTGAAIRHGVLCAIRWKIWVFTALTWTVLTAFMVLCVTGILDFNFDDIARVRPVSTIEYWFGSQVYAWLTLALHVGLGVFTVGATYVQCVRLSEFKKRRFYFVMWPFEAVVRWIPWFLLHSPVVLPIIIIWSHWYYVWTL